MALQNCHFFADACEKLCRDKKMHKFNSLGSFRCTYHGVPSAQSFNFNTNASRFVDCIGFFEPDT